MRKLTPVLWLHSLGLSQHQIASSCSISQSTLHPLQRYGLLDAANQPSLDIPRMNAP
jgi:hypothetical protein